LKTFKVDEIVGARFHCARHVNSPALQMVPVALWPTRDASEP
jgi:hypothetical protein